ncbi:MAG: hypothetical protein HeimC2_11440 [Candidatus Heimdallarchaeota archaeon LC_2]|nr:MAG: hypothetical protein HeimC2_11440 [Candidatus Heimdallarchaeota archaeon LC_2]
MKTVILPMHTMLIFRVFMGFQLVVSNKEDTLQIVTDSSIFTKFIYPIYNGTSTKEQNNY